MGIREASTVMGLLFIAWGCMPEGGGSKGGDDDDGPSGEGAGGSSGGPAALGALCAENQDCASGQCVRLGDIQFCSQDCDVDDACPEGFLCQLSHCVPSGGGSGGDTPVRGGAMGGGGPQAGEMGGGGAQGGEMGGGPMSAPDAGMGAGGQDPDMGVGERLLCGERDPALQCRVACVRTVQCLTEFCPHEPPDNYVQLCQDSCPNEPLVEIACDEDRGCDSLVARLTAGDPAIDAACYEGPCRLGDCGARGQCVDGLCECSLGYTGTRCDMPPSVERQNALCQAFLECAEACQDQACVRDCENENPAGAGFFNAFYACIGNNGCLGPDNQVDTECALENCRAQVTACYGEQ